MDLLRELRERRVPHYVVTYCIGSFGLVEFLEFLEGRTLFSPHLVNFCALTLLFLLPSVAMWAWAHGRPGPDTWGRITKFAIPANLVAALVVLLVLFQGKDLGAVTETVEIQDENGQVVEREVPKSAFRKLVILYNFDNNGPSEDEWLRHGLPFLLEIDLSQDPFVEGRGTSNMAASLRTAGDPEGMDLSRAMQRKIARELHFGYFLTGTLSREGDVWAVETELHAVESGRVVARGWASGTDVFGLADEISLQVRRDLDLPGSHLDNCPDMPIAEVLTDDVEAFAAFSEASVMATVRNEWEAAAPLLTDAVERDPSFALAQYMLSVVHLVGSRADAAIVASDAAMANLYRLPERLQLQIKAFYYMNTEQDSDKAMAVVDMWTQLYPQDLSAYSQKAYFHRLRGERLEAIAALDEILRIDPQQYDLLRNIAGLYREEGEFDRAEEYLRRYADHFPGDARSWIELADLYADFGELSRASEVLEKALLIEPGRLGAQLSLVDIETHLGRFDTVRQRLDTMLEAAETPQARQQVLGVRIDFCDAEGRIDDAMAEVEAWVPEARQIQLPHEVKLLQAFSARLVAQTGDAAEALATIEDLARDVPVLVDRMINYCRVEPLLALRRLDEAEAQLADTEALVEEMKIEVWRPLVKQGAGLLALERGDYETAEAHLREGIALRANSSQNMRLLAKALRLQERYGDAEKVAKDALKISPSSGRMNLEMARIRSAEGDAEGARRHLQTALVAWQHADADFAPAVEARDLLASLATAQ